MLMLPPHRHHLIPTYCITAYLRDAVRHFHRRVVVFGCVIGKVIVMITAAYLTLLPATWSLLTLTVVVHVADFSLLLLGTCWVTRCVLTYHHYTTYLCST